MSLTLKIEAPQDLGPQFETLYAALSNRQQINLEAATALADGIKDHFREENTSHKTAESLGASESGFWGRMSRGTVPSADANDGRVTMPREVAQRYFGGTITPQGGQTYLTFPASASAYGKRAADFPDLKFSFTLNPFGVLQPALVRDDAQSKVSKTTRGAHDQHIGLGKERTQQVVYFWLARKAVQPPDPSVLPSQDVAQAYVEYGVTKYLERNGLPA